jgi:phenylacetate-CoA ligase
MPRKDLVLMKSLDFVKKSNVNEHFQHFGSYLNMTPAEIKKIQLEKLQQLLVHTQKTVPYYQNILRSFDFDANETSYNNILEQIPILTRDIIQQNQNALLSRKFSLDHLIKGSSSGTTGIPINYYSDNNGMSAGVAAGYILWGMSGWYLGQRKVHIWGNQSSIVRWNTLSSKVKTFFINQKNIASTFLNDPDQINEVEKAIIRFKPVSLEGYSSSIYTLAKHFKNNGLKINSLRQVYTTAENLEDYQKELIEEVFAPVSDLYGSGEIMGIAALPVGENKYYIFDPHVIVETIDCGISGMKDILLTDLDNYGMPIIRYKIGDTIDELKKPEPNAKYPFNSFKKLQGRSSDIITLPNGKKFHPVNIFGGTLFRTFKGISGHKVIWNGVTLKFVFESKNFEEKESMHSALNDLLNQYQVDFSIDYVEKIKPSESGKHKYMEIIHCNKEVK